MVPNFDNYSWRGQPKKDIEDANRAQVAIYPNKEYNLRSLTLGFHDFDKQ